MKYRKGHEKVARVITTSDKPSRTQQCFKDDCNVNVILKKWRKTGVITHLKENEGYFADVTQFGDYQESLNTVLQAQSMFDDLPADIRKRFSNDPAEYVNFAMNPDNADEMVKLGLAKKQDPDPTSTILDVTGRSDTTKPKPEGEAGGTTNEPKGNGE